MLRHYIKVTEQSVAQYPTVAREQWIINWPGQVVIGGSQVFWTKEVTEAINTGGAKVGRCKLDPGLKAPGFNSST